MFDIENLKAAMDEMFDFICDLPSGTDGFECDFDAAFGELKKVESALRWIPVTERLPEKNNQWVLCLCVGGAMEVLKFDYTMWNWYSQYPGRCYMESYVTHWMPLPEPPKEVE